MLQSLFDIQVVTATATTTKATTLSTSRSIASTTNNSSSTNVVLFIIMISLCTIISLLFVSIFYIFVPKHIRYQYNRNHIIHIQWRIYVSIIYVIILIIFIKYCIPILLLKVVPSETISTESLYGLLLLNTNIYSNSIAIMKVLCHTSVLYLGSLIQSFITLYNVTMITIQEQQPQQQVSNKKNNTNNTNNSTVQNIQQFVYTVIQLWYNVHIQPIIDAIISLCSSTSYINNNNNQQQQPNDSNSTSTTTDNWILIRNIIIAPIIEECIFRYCITSLLLILFVQVQQVPVSVSTNIINNMNQQQEQILNTSSYDTTTTTTKLSVYDSLSYQQLLFICWIGPLFFGIAHIHHAITQLYQLYNESKKSNGSNSVYYNNTIRRIILSSLFQIVYTTLFGSYVTFVYICTNGSLLSIIICHSYFNYLGLPNIQCFLELLSSYKQRSSTNTNTNTNTHTRNNPIIVPLCISLLYIVGIILFYYGFNYW